MNEEFELWLSHISINESWIEGSLSEVYKRYVRVLFCNRKDGNTEGVFTESQVLSRFPSLTIDELLKQNPDQYEKTGFIKDDDGNRVVGWIDFYNTYLITPSDSLHDVFFAYKLKHIDLTKIDAFLDSHLEETFNNDTKTFLRFLKIILLKHENKIIGTKHIILVKDWAKSKKKGFKIEKTNEPKIENLIVPPFTLKEITEELAKLNTQGKTEKGFKKGLINAKDVLAILKISKSKLDRLETKGVITYTKIGGRRKYREADIYKYIDGLFKKG